MLVTSLCWWLYHGDRFEMLVAKSLCWRFFSLCWWFFDRQHPESVTNISNLSPTHLVSNIDVTVTSIKTKNVGCIFEILVTVLVILVSNIVGFQSVNSITNIQKLSPKFSRQHLEITNINKVLYHFDILLQAN